MSAIKYERPLGLRMGDLEYQQARRRRNNRRHRSRSLEFVRSIKTERGCMDCGYNAHPAALDFDHRPGEIKSFSIGTTVTRSRSALLAEIAKCDVVCANCHRVRTHQRREND